MITKTMCMLLAYSFVLISSFPDLFVTYGLHFVLDITYMGFFAYDEVQKTQLVTRYAREAFLKDPWITLASENI